MKTVNIRELHERTGNLVDAAAGGDVIIVVRRGRPVAELRPLSATTKGQVLPDRTALLARFPGVAGDSGRFLEQERS